MTTKTTKSMKKMTTKTMGKWTMMMKRGTIMMTTMMMKKPWVSYIRFMWIAQLFLSFLTSIPLSQFPDEEPAAKKPRSS
jgi:hypothetical protein